MVLIDIYDFSITIFIILLGIVNIPGRILFGMLADKKYLTPVMFNTVAVALGTFPLFLYDVYLQHHLWSQYIFATLYALSTCKYFLLKFELD